ncbi:MAG: PH domain-containing protein [Muribaculaceae bacterium]|nr:PH domain-containing protein [Muribaculaceae bacterium]
MKKKVEFSTTSLVLSTAGIVIFAVALFYYMFKNDSSLVYFYSALVFLLAFSVLWYSPMYVSVDEKTLNIGRSLRIKSIKLSDIQSVRISPPTMGERRICGSGGFFGYWGWFRERDLGTYFAYYGKASDCFLVTLTNGRKYMIGCNDPDEMVTAIQSAIHNG